MPPELLVHPDGTVPGDFFQSRVDSAHPAISLASHHRGVSAYSVGGSLWESRLDVVFLIAESEVSVIYFDGRPAWWEYFGNGRQILERQLVARLGGHNHVVVKTQRKIRHV
jgi:hypothetical protein